MYLPLGPFGGTQAAARPGKAKDESPGLKRSSNIIFEGFFVWFNNPKLKEEKHPSCEHEIETLSEVI